MAVEDEPCLSKRLATANYGIYGLRCSPRSSDGDFYAPVRVTFSPPNAGAISRFPQVGPKIHRLLVGIAADAPKPARPAMQSKSETDRQFKWKHIFAKEQAMRDRAVDKLHCD